SAPDIAAVQPKILSYADKTRFEYAGGAGGFIDRWGYPFCRGRIFDHVETDRGQYDRAVKIFWASGACMLVRKSVVEQIGLFDDDYFAHWEEIDFCWRAQNAGWEIWCEPRSTVFHVGGGTLHGADPRKTYLNFRNSLTTLAKILSLREATTKLAMRTALDGVATLKALLSGKRAYAAAILKAHGDFWRRLPRIRKKRPSVRPRPLCRLAGSWNGSVVWAHFVRRKKRFDQIIGSRDT
ncbi:MAG: glycosyltransferase, partial [Bacteroidia bacterium]|nr:glycosyltransferase [Bacteroidia bacterium]